MYISIYLIMELLEKLKFTLKDDEIIRKELSLYIYFYKIEYIIYIELRYNKRM